MGHVALQAHPGRKVRKGIENESVRKMYNSSKKTFQHEHIKMISRTKNDYQKLIF